MAGTKTKQKSTVDVTCLDNFQNYLVVHSSISFLDDNCLAISLIHSPTVQKLRIGSTTHPISGHANYKI